MLTYSNSKNYLLLSVAGVMVQGCVAYVDPYSETIDHTRYQNVVETRPPFYGFDVFYDYYDRPYYVDSYRRIIYVETKYYPYVKSHYQYRKTDYGRYAEDHDDNHRVTSHQDQPRVIDKRDDNRRVTSPQDQPRVIDKRDDNHRVTSPQDQPRVIDKRDDNHRVTSPQDQPRVIDMRDDNHRDTSPHDKPRFIDNRDDNRLKGNPNDISKPNHVDNTIVNHSKDTEDKKNGTGSNNSGRFNHNTDNSNNNHSNDSGRSY